MTREGPEELKLRKPRDIRECCIAADQAKAHLYEIKLQQKRLRRLKRQWNARLGLCLRLMGECDGRTGKVNQ